MPNPRNRELARPPGLDGRSLDQQVEERGTLLGRLLQTGTSIDFAWRNPSFVARVGSPAYAQTQAGAYSNDGGFSWTAFATQPAGVVNGQGTVAVEADASTIMWISSDVGMKPS